jgi:uncharacterized protein (AIM24 family)
MPGTANRKMEGTVSVILTGAGQYLICDDDSVLCCISQIMLMVRPC